MRTRSAQPDARAAAFAARAAADRLKPPLRLAAHDARGWALAPRGGDTLVLDEFGELWWCRVRGAEAIVVRAAWPEEVRSLGPTIRRAIASLER